MGHIYQGRLRWGGRIKGVTQDSWSTASVTAINLDKMVVIQNDPAILAQVEQVHFSPTLPHLWKTGLRECGGLPGVGGGGVHTVS